MKTQTAEQILQSHLNKLDVATLVTYLINFRDCSPETLRAFEPFLLEQKLALLLLEAAEGD
jgi:hypothetical protein